MDADSRRSLVLDAVVVWFLDDVGIVTRSSGDTRVSSMSAALGAPFVDFGQGFS